ncbi:MAG: cob(I)yrinic acid a,c-diamide adenosyltransferase [Gemmataceae bacterium]
MVTLSRIYTKTGDEGQTGLGDGSRVRKDDIRVAAYGEVDELNATLGLLGIYAPEVPEAELLFRVIQNDLFDLGADLCVPESETPPEYPQLRITPEQVTRLEQAIDRVNANLTPLRSFVLPGGSPAAAWLHLTRTVCRRAERAVVTLGASQAINPQALIYLNRLSDLFFVLSRAANQGGTGDVLWVPGASRGA